MSRSSNLRSAAALGAATIALMLPSMGAMAASTHRIDRVQLGQWATPGKEPRTKTECIDRTHVRGVNGKRAELCTEWRTQAKIYRTTSYLTLDAGKSVSKADRRSAEACLKPAAAAAQAVSSEDGGAPALAAARARFKTCTASHKVKPGAVFALDVEKHTDWSGWQ